MDRLPKSASKSSIENDVSELDEDDVAPMHLSTDMALHECAKNGSYNEMKALLSNKELNVNVIPEKEAASQGLSALHLAVRHNHMNCVKLLLARGADVNIEDNFGFKPVHDACLQGNLEVLQLLLHHGATADGIPKDGLGHLTPMLYAARHNHIDCLKRLSKKFGLDDAMLWDTASKRGNAKVLQYLSATDIPADMLPSWIHNSAVGGQTEFLSRILQTTGFELTEEMATIALLTAAQHGHTHFLGALIDYGVNPNICGKNNVTALHNAARYGQVESIVELIQSGANTESLTDERWTPLHVAVRQCQEDAVTTLIEMGACIDSKGGPLDETALHLAVVIGDIPVLKSLLQGNPSLLAQNKNGKTVLQLQLRGSIRDLLIKHAKS